MKNVLHSLFGKHLYYMLFIAIIINTSSCTLVKPNTNVGELEKFVAMSKGPCFGFCPVFTLTVYANGVVTYLGERNTNRQGTYLRVLEKTEFTKLKNALTKADLWQFQDIYKGRIPDLQTVSITVWEEGDFKSVVGKDGRPEVVMKIESQLEEIANSGDWEKVEEEGEAEAPINELIIQFKEGVNRKKWIKKYARQDGIIVKQLAPNSLYWLMSFNPEKIKGKEILRLIRNDSQVVSAELNKKLTLRRG